MFFGISKRYKFSVRFLSVMIYFLNLLAFFLFIVATWITAILMLLPVKDVALSAFVGIFFGIIQIWGLRIFAELTE